MVEQVAVNHLGVGSIPTERDCIMPQFDIVSLGAQVFGLLLTFLIFYVYNLNSMLTVYTEIKKFRNKKLSFGFSSLDGYNSDNTNLSKFKKYSLFF